MCVCDKVLGHGSPVLHLRVYLGTRKTSFFDSEPLKVWMLYDGIVESAMWPSKTYGQSRSPKWTALVTLSTSAQRKRVPGFLMHEDILHPPLLIRLKDG